jgi:hypothetical protein
VYHEVPNDDYDGTTINYVIEGRRYFWIGSFEGGRSMGLYSLDTISMRFARLIMILIVNHGNWMEGTV